MDRHGYDQVVPQADPGDVEPRSLMDLSSGYIKRAADQLPRQGSKAPWYLQQNYLLDLFTMKFARLEHPALAFSRRPRDHRAAPAPIAMQPPRAS